MERERKEERIEGKRGSDLLSLGKCENEFPLAVYINEIPSSGEAFNQPDRTVSAPPPTSTLLTATYRSVLTTDLNNRTDVMVTNLRNTLL